MVPTAWVFVVVSSDKQAETLPAQEDWAHRTASENGWVITRTFSDTSTGKHGARKLLENLLTELRAVKKSERPARVLMTRLDRTGRGLALEPIAALAEIYRLGVVVHTREDGDNLITRASDSIKPILRVLTGALENEARRDKSLNKHAEKRAKGLHAGHAPFGTVLVNGKPIPYEPEAAVVRELFNLRLAGWGYHRLSRYAKEHGPKKRKADGTFREMRWDESTVQRMLNVKTHRGITVPEEVYDAVQGLRHPSIDRTAKYEWPLRGAVKCSCGRMLSVTFSGPKNHRIRYYVCRYAAGHERYPYHRADVLEAAFRDLLQELAEDPNIASTVSVDLDSLRRERDALDAERQRLDGRRRRAWELAEEGGIDARELRDRVTEIAAEARRLESGIASLDATISGAIATRTARESIGAQIRGLLKVWGKVDVSERREIAKTVAAYVGGLYVEPPEKASRTRLLAGGQFPL